jgi:hypothetical protein
MYELAADVVEVPSLSGTDLYEVAGDYTAKVQGPYRRPRPITTVGLRCCTVSGARTPGAATQQ